MTGLVDVLMTLCCWCCWCVDGFMCLCVYVLMSWYLMCWCVVRWGVDALLRVVGSIRWCFNEYWCIELLMYSMSANAIRETQICYITSIRVHIDESQTWGLCFLDFLLFDLCYLPTSPLLPLLINMTPPFPRPICDASYIFCHRINWSSFRLTGQLTGQLLTMFSLHRCAVLPTNHHAATYVRILILVSRLTYW